MLDSRNASSAAACCYPAHSRPYALPFRKARVEDRLQPVEARPCFLDVIKARQVVSKAVLVISQIAPGAGLLEIVLRERAPLVVEILIRELLVALPHEEVAPSHATCTNRLERFAPVVPMQFTLEPPKDR